MRGRGDSASRADRAVFAGCALGGSAHHVRGGVVLLAAASSALMLFSVRVHPGLWVPQISATVSARKARLKLDDDSDSDSESTRQKHVAPVARRTGDARTSRAAVFLSSGRVLTGNECTQLRSGCLVKASSRCQGRPAAAARPGVSHRFGCGELFAIHAAIGTIGLEHAKRSSKRFHLCNAATRRNCCRYAARNGVQ